MNYKILGSSGLRVSELCLGTMTFGEEWGWGASFNESKDQFDLFAGQGGNFIDTANRYTEGTSEKIVGELIRGNRDYWVLATKFTLKDRNGDPNGWGNHRKNMVRSVEGSLRRMQTDYIDLLWIHIWDFTTRPDDVMRALDDLVRSGKVLYLGISDTPAWIVAQSNTLAELRGWNRFIAIQAEYSLVQREVDYDLLSMAKTFGLGITPWAPIAGGFLSGKYRNGEKDSKRSGFNTKFNTPRNEGILDKVLEIASTTGHSPSQVAVRWLMQRDPQIVPILGARRPDQLNETLGAADFVLSDDHFRELDEISRLDPVFPYSMWHNPRLFEEAMTGGTGQRIANWNKPF